MNIYDAGFYVGLSLMLGPIAYVLIRSLIIMYKPGKRLRILSKTGAVVELDFERADAESVIAFLDILLEDR